MLLPDRPGSDFSQQRAMLAGDRPPPGPEELRLRPLDVSALLDAVKSGHLLKGRALNTEAVAVVGHSWGATTGLQLAGGVPTDQRSGTVAVISRIPSAISAGCFSADG